MRWTTLSQALHIDWQWALSYVQYVSTWKSIRFPMWSTLCRSYLYCTIDFEAQVYLSKTLDICLPWPENDVGSTQMWSCLTVSLNGYYIKAIHPPKSHLWTAGFWNFVLVYREKLFFCVALYQLVNWDNYAKLEKSIRSVGRCASLLSSNDDKTWFWYFSGLTLTEWPKVSAWKV